LAASRPEMDAPTRTSKTAVGVSLIVVLAMLALAVYAPLSTLISGPALLVAGLSRVADRRNRIAEGVNLVLTAAGAALIGAAVLVSVVLVRW
jgi:hypothetical protein